MNTDLNTPYDVLRHYLVSLTFRFKHVTEGAPDGFGDVEVADGVRSPSRIVRHMTVLIQFVHEQFEATHAGKLEPLAWEAEVSRFLDAVSAFDLVLKNSTPMRETERNLRLEQVWQGPLIDAMTHIGQLASLRRMAGSPIEPVRYWQVEMPQLNA